MSKDEIFTIDLDDSIFKTTEKEKKERRNLLRKQLLENFDFLDATMTDEEINEKCTQHLLQEMEAMSEGEIKKRDEMLDKHLQEIVDSLEKEVENASSVPSFL